MAMNIIDKIIAKKNDVFGAEPITIAFFGDSVTQGCFELYKTAPRGAQTEFRVEDGYHTKLRSILQMLYPSVPINMIHAGISGDNAERGFGRIKRDVSVYKPDLTIVGFGLNDCCKGMEFLETYKNSLKGIFDELKAIGSEIIFLTPCLPAYEVSAEVTDDFVREFYDSMISVSNVTVDTFIDAARAVCAEAGVKVCDCFAIWKTLREKEVDTIRLLANRINHPTADMHWLFAFMLIKEMFEL